MTSAPSPPTATLLSHGGAALAVAGDELPPGSDLGRYQIVRLLGRGGMGCVYEAIHRDLGKRVAIKTLLPALAASSESRARFLREGQAAARIRHPHVVDVTDVVAEGMTTYLVMEYLEGEDLGARLARQGALSLPETADILLPVVAAVATAHDRGVIHRDLKPENVFLARSAQGAPCPKVVDFGISKVLGDPGALALTATSTAFGTLHYLPPEQLRGAREADARSDQYALGAVLYECLTGYRAFDGDGIYGVLKNVAEGNYLPARVRRPDLPAAVEAAIARALSIDPADRFLSVRSLAEILLDFASPAVRAHWALVLSAPDEIRRWPAEPDPSALERAPPEESSWSDRAARPRCDTWLLSPPPDAAADCLDRSAAVDDAALQLVPRRSWTARFILIGAVIAAATIAVAGVRGARPPPSPAPGPPSERHSQPVAPPWVPRPAPAVTAPAGAAPLVAPPVPAISLRQPRSPVVPAPRHKHPAPHRLRPVPPRPLTTSAPILE